MLYSFRNKQKNRRHEIIYNVEIIVEKQLLGFFSQFSKLTDEINENIFQNKEPDDLNDIKITEEEIIKAIDDLEENLAA